MKEVNLYKIDTNNELKIENPELAMKMQSEVQKVLMNGSKWVLGASGDECMTVYNTETGKTLTCSPGHAGCSVKNGAIDPEQKFIVTTGTDGYLNIYKLEGDSVKFDQKIQICEKKVKDDRTWQMSVQWLPEGESVIVSGNKSLGIVCKLEEDGDWALCHEDKI